MEEELVTFDTAKLAKEKGFNELCNYEKGVYGINTLIFQKKIRNSEFCKENIKIATKPTQSLLQKWLREKNCFVMVKHRIIGTIESPLIEFTYNGDNGERNNIWYPTYELALEQGLIECLKLLPNEKP